MGRQIIRNGDLTDSMDWLAYPWTLKDWRSDFWVEPPLVDWWLRNAGDSVTLEVV